MIFNLLTESTGSSSPEAGSPWGTWIIMGVLVLVIVAFMIFNRRNQKKRQEETKSMLDAIKPGNKVKTIGGICGIVVEVCDDNTFVLETGTEASGKSYLKFDKQAIYQTDAVVEKPAPVEAQEEAPAVEAAEAAKAAPVEAPAEEAEAAKEEKAE